MRIILTTGGTGGHIFPAVAVAEELRSQGAEILFVGAKQGPEARIAAEAGIPFVGLPVQGVLGRGWKAIGATLGLLKAVVPARRIIREFKPDVVVGFGAYASFAMLAAARIGGIPVGIHEQNAMPGLTNRLFSRLATRVFLSLPDVAGRFPQANCVLTGNPVRRSIADMACEPRTSGKHLLVVGGSQGAKAINSIVLASLDRLLAAGIQIRHQTGISDWERVMAGYQASGHDVSGVSPFIDRMDEAYAWADLVLCRAGASTVAELAVAGKPAVFVPFPYATNDHQTYNAQVMVKAGAAHLVPEKNLPAVDMGTLLITLLNDSEPLRVMGKAARACARPDAAHCVAEKILELCQGSNHA